MQIGIGHFTEEPLPLIWSRPVYKFGQSALGEVKNMAHSYAVRETRINRERHTQINLCGDCGVEVSATELLCRDCRKQVTVGSQNERRNTWDSN